MRIFKVGIIIAVCLLIIVISHKYLRTNSPMYNLVFSPSDLYNSLADDAFNLSNERLTKEFKIVHKYPGHYCIALIVENPVGSGVKYDSVFLLNISFIKNDKVVLARIVSDTSFWFWGGKEKSGFILMTYDTPRQLPVGVPLVAKIKVLKADSQFNFKYGLPKIIIRKLSDE